METARDWYTLHLLAAVVAVIAWACVAAYAADSPRRWTSSRWILLSPFATILLAWVGSYDPFTLLALAVACSGLLVGKPWLTLLGSVLLGFQHFAQGALALTALLLTLLAVQGNFATRLSWRTWVMAGGGLVAGKAILVGLRFTAGQGVEARGAWIDTYLGEWTISAVNTLPLLVWSLYAGAWGIIAYQFAHLGTVRARLWLALALTVGVTAQFFSGDRPRVFVIVMLPSLVALTIATLKECQQREWRIVLESFLWLGVPIIFWSTEISNVRVVDSALGSIRIFLGLP